MRTPETSVIIPVRNSERFIAEEIVSAIPQLGETDEVIIVDDGSTDATRSIVELIRDPRLRIVLAEDEVSSARNTGIAA